MPNYVEVIIDVTGDGDKIVDFMTKNKREKEDQYRELFGLRVDQNPDFDLINKNFLRISMRTAWNPPYEWFSEQSRSYSDLTITMVYVEHEGHDFYGVVRGDRQDHHGNFNKEREFVLSLSEWWKKMFDQDNEWCMEWIERDNEKKRRKSDNKIMACKFGE
jgi:hypothetical protein